MRMIGVDKYLLSSAFHHLALPEHPHHTPKLTNSPLIFSFKAAPWVNMGGVYFRHPRDRAEVSIPPLIVWPNAIMSANTVLLAASYMSGSSSLGSGQYAGIERRIRGWLVGENFR